MAKVNYFSKFGWSTTPKGAVDNNTAAFLGKFTGRIGPAIPDFAVDATPQQAAVTINAMIAEFVAQGWVERGFDANETEYSLAIRGVTMIPASTEWAYAPYEVFLDVTSIGVEFVQTRNGYSANDPSLWTLQYADAVKAGRLPGASCDWGNSLTALKNQLPSCKRVNLFVSWFGNDLRASECQLYPAVTGTGLGEMPHEWGCAGFTRATATVVSTHDGNAAYGGTPDDQSVIDAIADLKARGYAVTFTPFISMDVPHGNTLPDPYSGGTGQAVYPWRGRITKQYATADKTGAIATEIAAFVTQYRAFVLHYANLCAAAGGVDAFVVGTELRGLTWLRDAPGSHPFVTALVALAADAKAILPAAKLTYAADWSEYFGFQPPDGSGDVDFHLDPLWSSPNIDAIGIDVYWPLSDWRDDLPNADSFVPLGHAPRTIYDYDYLMGNIRGGEGYDWFYASDADRTAQTRTVISDGAYGEPWVYRYKDIASWWANAHHNRPAGVRDTAATVWEPQSKPVWFTELGVPSVDKGTNQPNVFYDPKSSESALPYFSVGNIDYLMQRRGVHAFLRYFDPDDGEFDEAQNPRSAVYDGRMVDLDNITIYTWDARPYPAFPQYDNVWSDAYNWPRGHWIGGKISDYQLPHEGSQMAVQTTYAPDHPYIVDPATGKLDKQYSDFFQAIQFVQQGAIANVPLAPTGAEVANAVNALLAALRAQKRIAE